MLNSGVTFFVIALFTGVLGFGGTTGASIENSAGTKFHIPNDQLISSVVEELKG